MYALVLAGGKGERLRPYTDHRPKPMVTINDRPILEYHLEWLKGEGVSHVVLLCGYLHEVIKDYFGDGRPWGLQIDYCIEDSPLGRGGAFKRGFQKVPPAERVVIGTNGDIITDQPLRPMIEAHLASGALASVMLVPYVSPYGIARIADNGRITGFEEKPRLPYWINGGVYIFSRECCHYLPDLGDHEDSTFPRLAEQGWLHGFRTHHYWKAIDTIKDLSEAAQQLSRLD